MIKRLLPLCLLSLFVLNSCSHPLKARGTFAEIRLNEGAEIRAELLTLNDSMLIVKRVSESTAIEYYKLDQIRSLELEGVSNGLWRPVLIIIGVLPAIGLIGALASGDANSISFGLVGTLIAVLSYIGFETTEPQTIYKWPLTAEDRSKLQLYTRFPYGVTDEQLKSLKTSYGIGDDD